MLNHFTISETIFQGFIFADAVRSFKSVGRTFKTKENLLHIFITVRYSEMYPFVALGNTQKLIYF